MILQARRKTRRKQPFLQIYRLFSFFLCFFLFYNSESYGKLWELKKTSPKDQKND